ncbi:hypothetical protein ACNJX9_20015 [Bradyrhizobium sp. DASA03076]
MKFRDLLAVFERIDEHACADLVGLCQFLPGPPAARSASRPA